MRQKSVPTKEPAERVIKGIRRATRGLFLRKTRYGLRVRPASPSFAAVRGFVENLYYRWSKNFLEAGKRRLAGDTARAATTDEVKELRREANALKEVAADLTLENR